MKKVTLLLIITSLFNVSGISQTTPMFDLTKDGVAPVVLTFDASYTAPILYAKVKEWVATTFKSPKSAIRIDNENTQVKVGFYKEKAWKIFEFNRDFWYDLEYTLNIDIKDSKCRVTFASQEVKYKVWYNKDGTTIKKFKDAEASFEATINESLSTLYKHIKEPKKVVKDDW